MPRFLLLAALLMAQLPCQALTEREIQGFINDAVKAGGGEVVIPPGVHMIEHGLQFKDAKNVRLIGMDMEACLLKLAPLAYAETSADTPAGSDRIPTTRMANLTPGMRLHIEADGELDSFTHKPRPYVLAVVKAVEGNTILLKEPLKFPVPAGRLIHNEDAPNVIEIKGACDGIRIEKLTLDGGATPADPPLSGHVQLCGVFGHGAYSYEKGPTGPPVKNVSVSRCIIQNCHGRGVALYAAEAPAVEDCTIMDTIDEAVDLDHFTTKAVIKHNHMARSGVGVELNDANDCLVSGNEFRECKTGINLWRWCKQPGLNENNRIEGNVFIQTKGNGVQIATGTANNTVSDNEITGSGLCGISLAGNGQIVKGNKVSGSGKKNVKVIEGQHQISGS